METVEHYIHQNKIRCNKISKNKIERCAIFEQAKQEKWHTPAIQSKVRAKAKKKGLKELT